MSSYKELFMQEYSDIYEKLNINIKKNPQVEQYKLYCSKLSRTANTEFAKGVKAEASGKFDKAIDHYSTTKQNFKELLKEADANIADEDILSWFIRLITSSRSVFSAASGILSFIKSDFNIKDVTRENVKDNIQMMISICDDSINRCKKSLNKKE